MMLALAPPRWSKPAKNSRNTRISWPDSRIWPKPRSAPARTAIRHSRHPRAPNPHRKGAPGHRRQVCAYNLSTGTLPLQDCHNARLACGISRSGRVSRTIFFQAPVRSQINYANWNFHRKIRRALRGAPPCTPRQQMLRDTASTHTALTVSRTAQAQDFLSYCALCGFWTSDHTKIKSHIRQAHRPQWNDHGQAAAEACKTSGCPAD